MSDRCHARHDEAPSAPADSMRQPLRRSQCGGNWIVDVILTRVMHPCIRLIADPLPIVWFSGTEENVLTSRQIREHALSANGEDQNCDQMITSTDSERSRIAVMDITVSKVSRVMHQAQTCGCRSKSRSIDGPYRGTRCASAPSHLWNTHDRS